VDPALGVRLLAERDDADIAAVLSRMQADDAADAIADLPQERRLAIIELLPEDRRRKVLSVLRFNAQTAGGLMVPDCISVPATSTVAEALKAVKDTRNVEGIAATTAFLVDEEGRLIGAIPLASLVRTDLHTWTGGLAESRPAHVHPDTDFVDLALVMSDYNLAVVPVTDTEHRILGVVTVDDVLEAAIPADWRRRGPGSHAVSEPSASSEG
jgi:Mg/Co/Ni transporter MgtE